MAKLEIGKKAPAFTLLNQSGQKIKLTDYVGKKVLIYFYPKASTSGCTTQSCAVRDAKAEFIKKGVEVLGISPDMPDKQEKFDQKNSLGFPLLSDPEHKIAEKYGVWAEKNMYGRKYMGIVRSSFLIDEKGKIINSWYKVSPKNTVPNAMQEL